MSARRRLAIFTTMLAAAALLPMVAAATPAPEPTDQPPPADDSAIPPLNPVEPADGLEEVVHSWALAPAGTAAGQAGNRPELSYVADPGAVLEDAVTLYNLSNVPLVFRIYPTDAFNNDDGDFDLLAPEVPPIGAGTWVDLGAEQVTVDANTQVTFPITITIPENASAGDHAGAILASNAAVSTGDSGEQFTVDRRTGTRLFVRVNGPLLPELSVEDLQVDVGTSLNPFGASAAVTYTIENRGNVRLGGDVIASIGGPFGIGEQSADVRRIADLLPGESVTFVEEFDSVPTLGVAVAKVDIDPTGSGGGEIATSSRQSLSLALPIGVILIVLAGVFAVLALRAYRRHRGHDDPDDGAAGGDDVVGLRDAERQLT
jgi:hypothetical protein